MTPAASIGHVGPDDWWNEQLTTEERLQALAWVDSHLEQLDRSRWAHDDDGPLYHAIAIDEGKLHVELFTANPDSSEIPPLVLLDDGAQTEWATFPSSKPPPATITAIIMARVGR